MSHLEFDRLSEIAELGDASARADESAHLSACAECRDAVQRVRSLLSAARALPREVAPPPEVWTGLRERMARRAARRSSWLNPGWLVAAAVVVFLVGGALLIGPGPGKGKAVKPTPPPTHVAVLTVEQRYTSTVDQLTQTLATERGRLPAAAASVVDRSLATIDTAIAEARTALTSDPDNQSLVEILSSHYERKVDLLQRATELGPSF